MHQRALYQFPISHYCEKARWVLDHKLLPYRVVNQFPGLHARFNKRLTGRPTVPLLCDGDAAISGSHAIAMYLEAQRLGPSLLPSGSAALAVHDALVQRFDEVVGPAVRRYVYGLVTPCAERFRKTFFRGYAGVPKLIGHMVARPISQAISKMYDVQANAVSALPDQFRREADALEGQLRSGAQYLVGDSLTLADITVASLFGPLVGPPCSPWAFDLGVPEFEVLRTELSARPIGQWIAARYGERPACLGA